MIQGGKSQNEWFKKENIFNLVGLHRSKKGWKTKTPFKNQSDQSFFLRPDFFDFDDGLELSLKADGQNSLTLHIPQLGLRGVQIVCPNPTCLNTNQNKMHLTIRCLCVYILEMQQ